MRVVIATDSFKGSLTATDVAHHLARGLRAGWPALAIEETPLSDGGEGLVKCLVTARGGRTAECRVTGPLGAPVTARYGWLPDDATAVIETAAASGLPLVPEGARNPWIATTRGTGELIRAALDGGARRLLIGLGGSATNDGGAGMLQALGVRLLDDAGRPIGPGAAGLTRLRRVDPSGLDPRLAQVEIVVAADVDNPLCGANGAAAVYGPQKGARPEDIPRLDAALQHFAELVEASLPVERRQGPGRLRDRPGAGAAGGLGFALMAFCAARLEPGAELVLGEIGARDRWRKADLVITGEGRMDASTLHGKLPVAVARAARVCGAEVIAVCGQLALPAERFRAVGIRAIYPLASDAVPAQRAIAEAPALLEALGRRIGQGLRDGRDLESL